MHTDSLKRHIEHLQESHQKLEKELHDLEKHHMEDSIKAHEIKKKKLKIKDEIARCNTDLYVRQYGMPNHG